MRCRKKCTTISQIRIWNWYRLVVHLHWFARTHTHHLNEQQCDGQPHHIISCVVQAIVFFFFLMREWFECFYSQLFTFSSLILYARLIQHHNNHTAVAQFNQRSDFCNVSHFRATKLNDSLCGVRSPFFCLLLALTRCASIYARHSRLKLIYWRVDDESMIYASKRWHSLYLGQPIHCISVIKIIIHHCKRS